MSNETALLVAGIHSALFFVFHCFFWKLFQWSEQLRKLSFINRQVMQILNICLTFVFLIFCYLFFFCSQELLTTSLGQVMLVAISLFWLLRAGLQIWYFGTENSTSAAFFAVFFLGATLPILPLF